MHVLTVHFAPIQYVHFYWFRSELASFFASPCVEFDG